MRRVRGVVHGAAAGLSAPQKGGRPAREATFDRAATPRPFFLPYSRDDVQRSFPASYTLVHPYAGDRAGLAGGTTPTAA